MKKHSIILVSLGLIYVVAISVSFTQCTDSALPTWTGGWGYVTFWNAYVANLEMNAQGTFFDERFNDAKKYPVAVKTGAGNQRHNPDLITDQFAALQFYQLGIPAPKAADGTDNKKAAERGIMVFNNKAKCASCHVPPLFTEGDGIRTNHLILVLMSFSPALHLVIPMLRMG